MKVKGLPVLPLRTERDLPSPSCLKGLTITRKPTGVYVSLRYTVEIEEPVEVPMKAVGLDVGVSARITASDGWSVERGSPDAERVAALQRRNARCGRGSNNRRKLYRPLARLRHRERVSNRNGCHRITTDLVRRYGVIVIEDLSLLSMIRSSRGTVEKPGTNVAAKSSLNRSIAEQTRGLLRQQLDYKTQWAGGRLVEVDPRGTSQTCSGCGHRDGDSRRGKVYDCVNCDVRTDADVNAAVNILRSGMVRHGGQAGGTSPPPGNRQNHSRDA